MDLWEQNVEESLMLACWRKTAAADSYSMTVDVLGVMDILDGESLTFVVRLMKCLQPFDWEPCLVASDLFSTLNFVALHTCFGEHLDSLVGYLERNQVAFFLGGKCPTHLNLVEIVSPYDVVVGSYHFLDLLSFLDHTYYAVV